MNKKNQKAEDEQRRIEIRKAVAQAWYNHSTSSKATASEFDTRRRNFKSQPTRFKQEAMSSMQSGKGQWGTSWDFAESLWDTYEIVSVSRKLETGLTLADPFSALDELNRVGKRKKESKNSLRNLFNRTSRRFSEDDIPAAGE